MPMRIEEVIARRTDLSTFLVHLTRDIGNAAARANLINIVAHGLLEARNPYGAAVTPLQNNWASTDSQRVVCFTETPLEHVHLLIEEIESRAYRFAAYGVGITKVQGRRRGANPVWYLDMTPGHDWLTNNVRALVNAAMGPAFDTSDIAQLTPFIEQMGTWPNGNRKEFWWEREWRNCGDFVLPATYFVFCPDTEIDDIAAAAEGVVAGSTNGLVFLDPRWGLERMIAHLADFSVEDIGPFPTP